MDAGDAVSVAAFYDGLSADYHLLFADWDAAITWQSRVLEAVLLPVLGPGPWTVLDAACGIGTQALGLAGRGHRVHASDLSGAAVERLRGEARSRGLTLASVEVADMRTLAAPAPGGFDAVLVCDNALPHLLDDAELATACVRLRAALRPGGVLLATIRDYDEVLAGRPTGTTVTPVRVIDDASGRRMVYQVWDWGADGERYAVTQFVVRGVPGAWTAHGHAGVYRALRRAVVDVALRAAGFTAVRWQMPGVSGYYQPLVLAQA